MTIEVLYSSLLFGLIVTIGLNIVGRILKDELTFEVKQSIIHFCFGCLFGALIGIYSKYVFFEVAIFSMVYIIGYIDAKLHCIFTNTIYILIGINVISVIVLNLGFDSAILGFVAGFGIYGIIYYVAKAIYKREAFGFGDVLLLGALGVYLGPINIAITSLLTFYVSIVGIVFMSVAGKVVGRKIEVAFGPYIGLATLIMALFSQEIVTLYQQVFLP